jgi:hypothetical protein
MNQFADFAKSPITHRKSPDPPILRWPDRKSPRGKADRARSFAAAQDDRAAEGADNQPPCVTRKRSDERRYASGKGRPRRKAGRRSARHVHIHAGRPHSPASVIGRSEPEDEGRIPTEWCELTISSAAHTPPHRLSVGRGEKMNQFADFAKSPITNRKSPDPPILRWPDRKSPRGKAGRARSFPAAQDDRAVEGADNQPPQVRHSRSSDERRVAKGRPRQKGEGGRRVTFTFMRAAQTLPHRLSVEANLRMREEYRRRAADS